MSNINTVTLSGNVTRDPEKVEGHPIVKFGLAVNRRYKKKDDDEYTEEVSFFDCTVFGNFGDLIARKIRKGQAVTVQGRMEEQRWETDEGKRSKHVVIVNEMDGAGFYVKDEDVPASETSETAPAASQTDEIPF